MYLIQVFPISANSSPEPLTYFHKDFLLKGTLVEIQIRSKKTKAIVASASPAKDAKVLIKKSDFSIKKIEQVMSLGFLSDHFLKAVWLASDRLASPFGSILNELVPSDVLSSPAGLPEVEVGKTFSMEPEIRGFMGDKNFRLDGYLALIAKVMEKNKSVLLLTPTIKRALDISAEIVNKGFDQDRLSVLHGNLSKKKFLEQWNNISLSIEPILVIGTFQALSAPCSRVGLIIVEEENGDAYKTFRSPFVDIKLVAELIADTLGASLVLGDIFLSPETYYKLKRNIDVQKKFETNGVENLLVDPSSEEEKTESPNISQTLLRILKASKGKRIFILANRKGIARATICRDCGEAVLCEKCNLPLGLHQEKGVRFFLCNSCGNRSASKRVCTRCSSWNLIPLGSGIDKVEADLRKLLPDIPVFKLDANTAKTETKASSIVADWKKDGGILLGTNKALGYLESAQMAVLISLDALFAEPGIDSQVRIFKLVEDLKSKADKLVIQSRHGDYGMVNELKSGAERVLQKDLEARENLGYPPFKVLVKVTFPEKDKVKIKNSLTKILAGKRIYENSSVGKGGQKNVVFLTKIDVEDWPHKTLTKYLKNQPPYIKVEINPNILTS